MFVPLFFISSGLRADILSSILGSIIDIHNLTNGVKRSTI